jgi:hypothetical protein
MDSVFMATKAIDGDIACGHDGRQVVGTRISFAGGYPPMPGGVRAPYLRRVISCFLRCVLSMGCSKRVDVA